MTRWEDVLPPEDLEVFRASGYGQRGRLGQKPALIVVDATYNFMGDRPEPILESIERFPSSCGPAAWRALPAIRNLIEASRSAEIPVVYTLPARRDDAADAGRWAAKFSRALEASDSNQIVADIAPKQGDYVIAKAKPSAFFGTPLTSYLIQKGIDSLLLAGGSTSGCVRATVVDAFSYNYAVAVVEEAVFDRSQLVNDVSLFDIQAKYGDVVSLDEATAYLERTSVGSAQASLA